VKTCPLCGKEYPDTVKFCPVDGSTLRAKNPTADLVGQVVADRYAIIRKLGEGGMGAVYLGEHVKMGRKSAIKVMNPAMANDPDAISRFNREASNASRISHPNVCQIYDFGEKPEGIIYLAMEFIEGAALTAIIEREGALPPARAVRILKQSADALAAAHDLGIVHRDLKPDNIMIVQGRDGADIAKVVDFGIAKAVAGDDAGQKVTKTGLVVGTPEYMSPEQLSGDKLDGRSDIYSLGLVFYRMLTGVLPFQADSAQETMIKRLTDDPMPLADARPDIAFPPTLQAVLDKALARTPAARYASASVFGRDAENAVAALAVPGTRVAEPVTTAATQLLDAEHARQAARAKGAPPTAVARAAAAKKFPLVPVLGGVGGVGVIAVVAVLAMGGLKKTPAAGTPSAADTAKAAAPAPGSTQSAANAKASPTGAEPGPGTNRTARTGAQPVPRPQAQVSTPNRASSVSVADSLSAANDAFDAEQFDTAMRIGSWIYGYPGATPTEKAHAAVVVATIYGQRNDVPNTLNWYRNALKYDPSNQRVRDAITQLGGTP
jgi:eukaryotic-like serine/threonine-protein kinase